jgi:hypothetical protein
MYAILGVWRADADKQPAFDKRNLPTLVHEFAHAYVNPLVDHFPSLDRAGDAIYQHVRAAMQNQAYGDGHTLVCESLVRASTARYILAHDGAAAARSALEEEQRRSFVWTPELFDLLGAYEAGREHYPTLEAFMPKVAGYFEDLSPQVAAMVQNYDATRPKVIAIIPANGTLDVDPAITSVTIKFDHAMRGGYSFCWTENKELYPKFGKLAYDETRTKLTIEVAFEPSRNYEFRLNCAPGFVADDGKSMQEIAVKWRTRAAQ